MKFNQSRALRAAATGQAIGFRCARHNFAGFNPATPRHRDTHDMLKNQPDQGSTNDSVVDSAADCLSLELGQPLLVEFDDATGALSIRCTAQPATDVRRMIHVRLQIPIGVTRGLLHAVKVVEQHLDRESDARAPTHPLFYQ